MGGSLDIEGAAGAACPEGGAELCNFPLNALLLQGLQRDLRLPDAERNFKHDPFALKAVGIAE
ncbi:hypothetical protein D3C75_994860 [compost metagenome]